MTTTSDLAELLGARMRAFFAACGDPEAGEALHALYAADAPLYFRQAVRPRSDVPRAEFAWVLAAHARVLARTGDVPRPALGEPAIATVRDEGDRAVAWFTAPETLTGEPITGAIGFVREGDAWQVGWATLGAPADWSYALGRAQAVGEVASADAAKLPAPRSWLDVAYYRTRLIPRPPITLLPEARFSCQSSGRCCNIGFDVQVAPTAQAAIDAIPWDAVAPRLAGTQLDRLADGKLQLKGPDEACRFLDEHRHCIIHKALGRAIFPICAVYPVTFALTPDGVDATTSMTCPSARAGLGLPLAARLDDLYDRLAIRPPTPPDAFAIAGGVDAGWPAFRALEGQLLAVLERPDLALPERLREGERLIAAALGEPEVTAAPRENLDLMIDAARRRVLPDEALPPPPPPGRPSPELEAQLVATLRGLLFMKQYSYRFGLRRTWRVMIFLALVAVALEAGGERAGLSDHVAWGLNSHFTHTAIFELLVKDEARRTDLIGWFDEPGFGAELLALFSAPAAEAVR